MASFVVTPGLFPVGTTVSARLRTNWPPSERDAPTGTPGSATTSGDIDAAGELTLTGLTDDTRYILHGTIGADEKYVQIQTPPAAAEGGGGGGGAVTVADGDDEAIGATTSSESASGNGTVVGILKRLRTLLGGGLPTDLSGSGNLKVAVEEGGVAAGASTEAKQDTLIGHVDGLEAQIGEVQATPTANTVLSRLKAIDDTLVSGGGSATESTLQDILAKILVAPANAAKQDTIIGHVDGIEALLTADAITAAVRDRIGEVQASPTANTLLARLKTIEGYSDGIETALALLATAAQVGEVQATPTANTVLSRLKAINDTLVAGGGDATEATLAAIEALLGGTLTTVISGTADADVTSIATGQGKTLVPVKIDCASSGNNTLVAAAGSGLKIKVVSYVIVADDAVDAKFQSGASGTDLSGPMELSGGTGVGIAGQPSAHLLQTADNALLNLNLSGAVQVSGHLTYFAEA